MNNCPFCHSFDFKVTGEMTHDGNHIVFAMCKKCGCRGPIVRGEGKTCTDQETAEAYKLWNKREDVELERFKGEVRK